MHIESLLNPESILCNVRARSKKHALEILSELLATSRPELAPAEIFDSLISRERLGCTALSQGVAIPHGRIAGTEENIGAFVQLAEPVDFDAPDGMPVDLIFGLLVPEDCGDAHLDDLREIARVLSDPEIRQHLHDAASSRDLYELLTRQALSRAGTT